MGAFWHIDPQAVPLDKAAQFCAAEIEGDYQRLAFLSIWNAILRNRNSAPVPPQSGAEVSQPDTSPVETAREPARQAPANPPAAPISHEKDALPYLTYTSFHSKPAPTIAQPAASAAAANETHAAKILKFLKGINERFNGAPFELQLATIAKKCELDQSSVRNALAMLDRDGKVTVKPPLQKGWSHRFAFPEAAR